jgi:protein-tyrosine phosphatase
VIDLHSHLLPGVDDGARTVEEALATLMVMREAGVTGVCLTPHFEASRVEAGPPAAFDEAFARLAPLAPEGLDLHRGVELMLDRPLPEGAADDRRFTLGGTRYLLVEFPPAVAAPAARNALQRVVQIGLIPVLAHPERYRCATPAVVAEWRSVGALMQVDATTAFQPRTRGDRARALLAHGLADVLAADNHGDRRTVGAAFVALCREGFTEAADLLVRGNPEAILADGPPRPVPPVVFPETLRGRLRRLLNPED